MPLGRTHLSNMKEYTLMANPVETISNQEEVDLRAKINALRSEVTKVPSASVLQTEDAELEVARRLDNLSMKLDKVDEMISSTITADPQVRSILSSTSDIWMPVITATSDERRQFSSLVKDEEHKSDENKFI
ncbi:hypothetical protein KSS87_015014 [Heliosperma pusillum]|nr:hypothetical protein KSS87_017536 [Heliosperma pusillum]KAH9614568.1 hypothetical protein KSS87_015014 [Heliosperma pusillum]